MQTIKLQNKAKKEIWRFIKKNRSINPCGSGTIEIGKGGDCRTGITSIKRIEISLNCESNDVLDVLGRAISNFFTDFSLSSGRGRDKLNSFLIKITFERMHPDNVQRRSCLYCLEKNETAESVWFITQKKQEIYFSEYTYYNRQEKQDAEKIVNF